MNNQEFPYDQTPFLRNNNKFAVSFLGRNAYKFITRKGIVKILGITSRGVFLQNQDGLISFLSGESYHGPLTINLQNEFDFNDCFSLSCTGQIMDNRLVFPKCQILLTCNTHIWSPPLIIFSRSSLSQAIQRGIGLANIILEEYKDGLFFTFLHQLITDLSGITRTSFWSLFPELDSKDAFGNQLLKYIGLGSGLTPAGDDFISGFLLAQFYLRKEYFAVEKVRDIGVRIQVEACRKTTALSAALISCALEGAADERLLTGLSWLAQGGKNISQVRDAILSYGHSSGIDALAGMLAAIIPEYFFERQ